MIIAGNWKLNKSPTETTSFLSELLELSKGLHQEQLIVCPPQISLMSCSESLQGSAIKWGGQNICTSDSGAFTGETSISHIKELGASFVLVGHSERRSLFKETNKEINEKVKLALSQSVSPILCIGETFSERESGQTKAVLNNHLEQALSGVDQLSLSEKMSTSGLQVIIAYEPVWAIGTGHVATPEQVQSTHEDIRVCLKKLYNEDQSKKVNILYGGSVKPANCKELSELPGVDGFLVGGASLKAESFLQILKTCPIAISN